MSTGVQKRRARGLTLIELMVALVIFSILGVLSYRAVSTATDNAQRMAGDFQRWHNVSQFFQTVESDLLQMVARPEGPGTTPSTLFTSSNNVELSFLRLDGAGATVRRRGYRFVGDHIVLLRWPGVSAQTPPAEDVVLDNVRAWRVSFITDQGTRLLSWPPGNPADANRPPAAIDMELDLADYGTIRRVFALR